MILLGAKLFLIWMLLAIGAVGIAVAIYSCTHKETEPESTWKEHKKSESPEIPEEKKDFWDA